MKTVRARAFFLAVAAGAVLSSSGCMTSLKKTAYNSLDPAVRLEPLGKDEYTVLGVVEGSGTNIATPSYKAYLTGNFMGNVMLPYVPRGTSLRQMQEMVGGWQSREGVIAGMAVRLAIANALYNAMQAKPDADALINVEIVQGTDKVFWFFVPIHTTNVTVRATAIKVKEG